MSAKEKETVQWKMVEINKVGAGNGETLPPSPTPLLLTSSKCFRLFFASFLCIVINLCGRQSRPDINVTRLTISCCLKWDWCSPQRANCTKPRHIIIVANGVLKVMMPGQGHRTMGSRQTMVQLGRGPIGCSRFAEVQNACMRICKICFWRETYARMSFSTCKQVHNSEENLHVIGLVQFFM
jgi:hypothetical protein